MKLNWNFPWGWGWGEFSEGCKIEKIPCREYGYFLELHNTGLGDLKRFQDDPNMDTILNIT